MLRIKHTYEIETVAKDEFLKDLNNVCNPRLNALSLRFIRQTQGSAGDGGIKPAGLEVASRIVELDYEQGSGVWREIHRKQG